MKIVKNIVKIIKKYDEIYISTHKNIDGDSFSSSYGLALAIKEKYPNKKVKVLTDLKYLKTNFPFLEIKKSMFAKKTSKKALGIIGDTAAKNRIQFFTELFKCQKIICFDHHQNKVDFKTALYWSEPDYPASALQAAKIALKMKKVLKEETAIALLFGILTDTNFFKYSTNKTIAPIVYSKLIKFTSDKKLNELFVRMSTKTKKDLEVQKYVYNNIKYQKNVAYIIFPIKMTKKYDYGTLKTKIGLLANIQGYECWAMFVAQEDGSYKTSLRTSTKNVNQIAKKYGGGGHIKASGTKAKNSNEVMKIIKDLTKI